MSRIYSNAPGGVASLTIRHFLEYAGSIYYYLGVYRFYGVRVPSQGVITGLGLQIAQNVSGVSCYQIYIENGKAAQITNVNSSLISSSISLCKL